MRKYQDRDYAVSKFRPNIVYRFADGVVEVTLQDFLRDNPGKSEQDFAALLEMKAPVAEDEFRNICHYAHSVMAAAVEKGVKYGRKTGEIVQDEEKRFLLGHFMQKKHVTLT